jgi:hypothetical protein
MRMQHIDVSNTVPEMMKHHVSQKAVYRWWDKTFLTLAICHMLLSIEEYMLQSLISYVVSMSTDLLSRPWVM